MTILDLEGRSIVEIFNIFKILINILNILNINFCFINFNTFLF